MSGNAPPFKLFFEMIFLESYSCLETSKQKSIDKAVKLLAANPRHPSLNVHKAKNVKAKYATGGTHVFIAYATSSMRLTFEYGPEPGMIALRNCAPHDRCERKI